MPQAIFFMHIAKTAGSYVNRLFLDALGGDRAVEHFLQRYPTHEAVAQAVNDEGVVFLSGHVYLRLWNELSRTVGRPFLRVTALRDPIEHLASHILWLDHYNLPEKRAEYARLSEPHQRLVDRIGQVDLADCGSVDHFLTHLPAGGVQLLDNCQARYFVSGPGSRTGHHDPLTLAHCEEITRAARGFDLIIRQDRMDEGVARIAALAGLTLSAPAGRVNEAASARRIDTANPILRAVFGKRTLVDQWLWRNLVSGRIGNGLADANPAQAAGAAAVGDMVAVEGAVDLGDVAAAG